MESTWQIISGLKTFGRGILDSKVKQQLAAVIAYS